jgi:hypothetical protein
MFRRTVITSVLVVMFGWSSIAAAHPRSDQECREAREFIENAAMSRDNGMDGMTFVSKLLADFMAIRSFPAELRWFVQDQQDEELLLAAVSDVFERPGEPHTHGRSFLERCVGRI